jgi:hypothetical protein
MTQLYDTDYVIIKADGEPLEGLDIIYHYTQIIDSINGNGGYKLHDGEELVAMTALPQALQERYIAYLTEEVTA